MRFRAFCPSLFKQWGIPLKSLAAAENTNPDICVPSIAATLPQLSHLPSRLPASCLTLDGADRQPMRVEQKTKKATPEQCAFPKHDFVHFTIIIIQWVTERQSGRDYNNSEY